MKRDLSPAAATLQKGRAFLRGRRREAAAAASLEAAFRARAEPAAGGHLRWTGHWTKNNVPGLRYGGSFHTAYRVAFRLRTGREAAGKALPECDYPGCVEPAHVDDAPGRNQTRDTYAAIFGAEPTA